MAIYIGSSLTATGSISSGFSLIKAGANAPLRTPTTEDGKATVLNRRRFNALKRSLPPPKPSNGASQRDGAIARAHIVSRICARASTFSLVQMCIY